MRNVKKKKKKNLVVKFLIIVLSSVIVYSSIAFGGIYAYLKLNPQPVYDPSKQTSALMTMEDIQEQKNSAIKDNGMFANVLTPPVRTNFLIVGVDKNENLTDSIMVGSFVSTTNEINLVSIPRDTFVELESDKLKKLREAKRSAPSTMKINAVNAYGGDKLGIELLQSEIEEILGIKIDYYVKVNIEAFREIVDSVGGIYFDVPKGGLRYSDPTQDLYINLKGGYQLLNGEQAEGLVRFRKGYAQQDLQRVKVQQEFVKEFITQIMAKENLRNNIPTLISNYIKHVETNFTIDDLPKYIKCINSLNTNNLNSETLPGYPDMIGGASYYINSPTETKELVNKYFYTTAIVDEEETEDSSTEENDE